MRVTPLKAIRLKCLDCCCDSAAEVRDCEIEHCPLWQFRFGKNPARKGVGRKKTENSERDALNADLSD